MLKKKDESSNEIILENFPKHSLLELAGILNNKESDELKKHIKNRRMASRKRIERITEKKKSNALKETFGILKLKKSTKAILKAVDKEGWDFR